MTLFTKGDEKNFEENDIDDCVKNFLNSPEKRFQIHNYNFNYITEELIGYLGSYQRGSIKFEVDGQHEVLNLFIKSLPLNKNQAEIVESYGFFKREKNVYSRIFTKFTKRKEYDKVFPYCFLATDNYLFCEDLGILGYRNVNKRESFDDDHCFIALTQIAKFHAESVILEESISNGYQIKNEFKDFLNEIGYENNGWYVAGKNAGLAAAKTSPNLLNNLNMPLFEKKWHEFLDTALNLCKASEIYRNVLCHRDLWCNNFMFRYDEGGKPIQGMIVDFQGCGCMPPAGDVVSFIYLNVMDKRRHTNLDNYLRHYHSVLCEEIKKKNIQAENWFSWETFRKSCEEYKKLALMQCIILHQLGLIDGKCSDILFKNDHSYDYLMEVCRDEAILQLMQRDSVYKEKFMFSIEEVINLCL